MLLLNIAVFHCLTPLSQTFLLLLLYTQRKLRQSQMEGCDAFSFSFSQNKWTFFYKSLILLCVSSLYFLLSSLLKPVSLKISSRKSSFTSNCLPLTKYIQLWQHFLNYNNINITLNIHSSDIYYEFLFDECRVNKPYCE